jgi:hypothetical protein
MVRAVASGAAVACVATWWVCGVCRREKSSGIDGQMGNVGGAECTGLLGGGWPLDTGIKL